MPVRRVAGNAIRLPPRKTKSRSNAARSFMRLKAWTTTVRPLMPCCPPCQDPTRISRRFLGGVTVLNITKAQRVAVSKAGKLTTKAARLTAIPYAVWANRGLTPMAVWLARDAATARPIRPPTLASQAKVTTSFARDGMNTAYLNDQLLPQNFTDGFAPNFDFWPHKGTSEWITYEFAQPTKVSAVRVSWFDDTGSGECRLPVSWRITYRDAITNGNPCSTPPNTRSRNATPFASPSTP
jgi:hypothetical protein